MGVTKEANHWPLSAEALLSCAPGPVSVTVCVLIGWGVTASDLPLLGEGAAGKKGCSAGDDRREEDADRLKTSNPLL